MESYEKYLAECEAKDKLEGVDSSLDDIDDDTKTCNASEQSSDKWREQRETLEMLKKELNRMQNGINVTDWDYLLEENEAEADANSETVHEQENKDRKDLRQNEAVKAPKTSMEKEGEKPEGKCDDKKKDK